MTSGHSVRALRRALGQQRSALGRLVRALFAAALLAGAGEALAAEPTSELPTGGLVYPGLQAFVTEREDIVLGAQQVRGTYIIRNAIDEERSALIAFPLPDIDMLALDGANVDVPAYDPQNPTNFVGFSALVDGQAVETFVESRALALGLIDVTAVLRGLNLPLYPFNPDLPQLLGALPENTKADLIARGIVRSSDGQPEPLWQLKTTLFWQQPFGRGQVRTIVIAYRPIAGALAWSNDTGPALKQRYCIPDRVESELNARAANGRQASVRWVHFLAYAGSSARGTALSYRSAIDIGGSTAAFTCRAGLAEGSGARETLVPNHQPDDEFQVLFVE